MINVINDYNNISTATTVQVFTGSGVLEAVVVNATSTGTVTISDSLSTTAPAIATLKASVVEGTYRYGIRFTNGLRVANQATSDITIVYRSS